METKESSVQFEYLYDPANELRVVTFGWRRDGEKAVEYAFAVNRVVSPPDKPDVMISTREQRFYDQHNFKTARLTVMRRLNSKRKRRIVIGERGSVLEYIIDNFTFYLSTSPKTSLPPSVRIAVITGVLWRIERAKRHKERTDEANRMLTEIAGSQERDRNCRSGVVDVKEP